MVLQHLKLRKGASKAGKNPVKIGGKTWCDAMASRQLFFLNPKGLLEEKQISWRELGVGTITIFLFKVSRNFG